MKLRNYTPLDPAWLRQVVAAVKPSNVSKFDISFKNCGSGGHRGRAYWAGCSYHNSDAQLVVVSLSGRARYPYSTVKGNGYIQTKLYSLAEAALFITAHELRHLWQAKVESGRRVWGARGQFSERDADAYAIQMVRRYRRGELAC